MSHPILAAVALAAIAVGGGMALENHYERTGTTPIASAEALPSKIPTSLPSMQSVKGSFGHAERVAYSYTDPLGRQIANGIKSGGHLR